MMRPGSRCGSRRCALAEGWSRRCRDFGRVRAFSSEGEPGSRQENASKEFRAPFRFDRNGTLKQFPLQWLHPSRRIAEPVIGRAFARPVGDAPQDEVSDPHGEKRVFARLEHEARGEEANDSSETENAPAKRHSALMLAAFT